MNAMCFSVTDGTASFSGQKTTLPELEQLILSGNRLTSIPEGLCSLTTLKELYLNRNEIAEMPPSFTQLQKLRILDLADNNISLLPPFITSLSSLREINFSYNRLSSLPPEIVKLTNLSVLYLMHNKLTELPQYLQAMRNGNCYHMDLEDNLIPNLTSLLAGTKKKKRKRSTSKQDNEKLNKYKDEKSRVAGISEMMGKRPHMEDTVSSHLAFSGIDGSFLSVPPRLGILTNLSVFLQVMISLQCLMVTPGGPRLYSRPITSTGCWQRR